MSEITTPSYYNHPVLGETAEYVAHMPYFQGAAFKYVLRAGNKPGVPALDDLAKAKECLEIQLGNENNPTVVIPNRLRERLWEYHLSVSREGNHVELWRYKVLREIADGFIDSRILEFINSLGHALKEQEKTK